MVEGDDFRERLAELAALESRCVLGSGPQRAVGQIVGIEALVGMDRLRVVKEAGGKFLLGKQ